MLNTLKVTGNSTFIYIYRAPSSKKWPMFIHVHPCAKYEWIKIQLKIN